MIQCRKKMFLFVFCLTMCFILAGCGKGYNNEYAIGIIQTQEYKQKSKISFYDENLQAIKSITYPYPNISYDGFSNSLIEDDKLFLLPKGHGDKLDYGKVISVSLENGEVNEFDFSRTNITGFDYDKNKIYAASNLNGVSYIDCYNIDSNEVQSYETHEYIIDTVVAGDNELYGIAMDWEKEEYMLCRIDVNEQSSMELYRIQAEMIPAYLVYYNDRVYFVNEDLLYEYQVDKEQMVMHQLPHTNAYNLLLQNGKLYIGCTDLYEEKTSYVDVFDTSSGQIEQLIETDSTILQMEISGTNNDVIYVLNYESLVKYRMVDGNILIDGEIELPKEDDFYIGGFYVNNQMKN